MIIEHTFTKGEKKVWMDRLLLAIRVVMANNHLKEIKPLLESSNDIANHSMPDLNRFDTSLRASSSAKGEAHRFGLESSINKVLIDEGARNEKIQCADSVYFINSPLGSKEKSQPDFNEFPSSCVVEVLTDDIDDIISLAETILGEIVGILEKDILEGTIHNGKYGLQNRRSIETSPYPWITFQETLYTLGIDINRLVDLSRAEKQLISNESTWPFWIYNYPSTVRDTRCCKNLMSSYELIFPYGYGALIKGGIHAWNHLTNLNGIPHLSNSNTSKLICHQTALGANFSITSANFSIDLSSLISFISGEI
nr:hypothetical protein [Pseudomonas luteola]